MCGKTLKIRVLKVNIPWYNVSSFSYTHEPSSSKLMPHSAGMPTRSVCLLLFLFGAQCQSLCSLAYMICEIGLLV